MAPRAYSVLLRAASAPRHADEVQAFIAVVLRAKHFASTGAYFGERRRFTIRTRYFRHADSACELPYTLLPIAAAIMLDLMMAFIVCVMMLLIFAISVACAQMQASRCSQSFRYTLFTLHILFYDSKLLLLQLRYFRHDICASDFVSLITHVYSSVTIDVACRHGATVYDMPPDAATTRIYRYCRFRLAADTRFLLSPFRPPLQYRFRLLPPMDAARLPAFLRRRHVAVIIFATIFCTMAPSSRRY